MTVAQRLSRFIKKAYPPRLQVPFAICLFLALSGGFATISTGAQDWRFDRYMLLGITTLLLVFFYLRVIDEVKDYDYDRQVNPERPLVTGVVSHRDLAWFGLVTMLVVAALNYAAPPLAFMLVLIDMAYGALLLKLEQWSPPIKNGPILGLVVVYPVNICLSCYVLALTSGPYARAFEPAQAWLIAAITLAFLHFEFARKTVRKEFAKPGEKSYADRLGMRLATALCLAFAVSAGGIVLALFLSSPRPGLGAWTAWLPLLPILGAVLQMTKFYLIKDRPVNMRTAGSLFLLSFYAAIIFHSLTVTHS